MLNGEGFDAPVEPIVTDPPETVPVKGSEAGIGAMLEVASPVPMYPLLIAAMAFPTGVVLSPSSAAHLVVIVPEAVPVIVADESVATWVWKGKLPAVKVFVIALVTPPNGTVPNSGLAPAPIGMRPRKSGKLNIVCLSPPYVNPSIE